MPWYIQTFDLETDDVFQVEVDRETARKARQAGAVKVQDHPIPGLAIKSRYRSERLPIGETPR